MYILELVAEVAPFSYAGGLARGVRYLSLALLKRGHDVRIMTPFHLNVSAYIAQNKKSLVYNTARIDTKQTGNHLDSHICVVSYKQKKNEPHMYFVDYPDFFSKRSSIYGYADDYQRFYLFSQACADWLLMEYAKTKKRPDIIHCHDWHTGYFVDMLKRQKKYAHLADIPILFTVHNFKYQNENKFQYMKGTDVDEGKTALARLNSLSLKEQNSLTRGMMFSELINTVSPTHANEIFLPEYSYNLVNFMPKVRHKLHGILNGLDYNRINPATHPKVHDHYSLNNFAEKRFLNKRFLRSVFALPDTGNAPIFCYVGRMTSQKGLEVLLAAMKVILSTDPQAQLVAVGDGEDHYCELFWKFTKLFPQQSNVKLKHDIHLPNQIFSGADITLIPSNFEPGGIVALETLRYGSVPIARRTGGLKDIISNYNPKTTQGNGFLYNHNSPSTLITTMRRALDLYEKPSVWNKIVHNCMSYRRTWDDAAIEYEHLFEKLHKQPQSSL